MKTRKIAIIWGEDVYIDDYGKFVPNSITDWAEVTEDEYKLLHRWIHNVGSIYRIVEMPTVPMQGFVLDTVQKCIEICDSKKKEQEAYEAKKKETQQKRKETKKQKELEKALKIIEEHQIYLTDQLNG